MSRIEGSLARQAFATSEYLNVHSAFFFRFSTPRLRGFVVVERNGARNVALFQDCKNCQSKWPPNTFETASLAG